MNYLTLNWEQVTESSMGSRLAVSELQKTVE